MAEQTPPAPVIIIKKKKACHGGHHGGAWKVAFADFVTALMALFIVLWLMNTDPKVQEAVGGYFRDPSGSGKQTGSGQAGSGEGISVSKTDMGQLKEKLEGALRSLPEFPALKDHVAMTVSGEGLRVELLESEDGMFFESGSPRPSKSGEQLLRLLAQQLSKLPNPVLIEGHTDSRPFTGGTGYTNWELSVDRANAARRLMEADGLRPNQIAQVRGFADRRPRVPDNPEDVSNRRVSVIVQYMPRKASTKAARAPAADPPGAAGDEEGKAAHR